MTLESVAWRSALQEAILDPISGQLMTSAVTLVPCGHVVNQDTALNCNGRCPINNQLFERYLPSYGIQALAKAASELPLKDKNLILEGLNVQISKQCDAPKIFYTFEKVKSSMQPSSDTHYVDSQYSHLEKESNAEIVKRRILASLNSPASKSLDS